jgi:hypothetical protein
MKLCFLAFAFAVAGMGQAQAAHSLFTPLQERKVLEGVQEACNNTWCEGDFGYDFKKFHCEKSSCQLDFDIIIYTIFDANGRPDQVSAEHHPVTCTYSPVRRLRDVLNQNKTYVSDKYFLSLAKCIDEKAELIAKEKAPRLPPGEVPPPDEPKVDMPLPVEVNQIPQLTPQSPFDFGSALQGIQP